MPRPDIDSIARRLSKSANHPLSDECWTLLSHVDAMEAERETLIKIAVKAKAFLESTERSVLNYKEREDLEDAIVMWEKISSPGGYNDGQHA